MALATRHARRRSGHRCNHGIRLDRYADPPSKTRALDVGPGRCGYLPALVSWTGGDWDGVELDAHRRDWTLVTRRGYAEHLLQRLCPECRYRAGSVLALCERYATVTWFLPFVAPAAFSATRLPQRFFAPRELPAHVHSLLKPGGQALIVNQGEHEAAVQRALFSDAGIPARALGLLHSDFRFFQTPRYGWRL